MKKIIFLIGVVFSLFSCDFNRTKNLRDTNYMLMDDPMGYVDIYYNINGGGIGVTSDNLAGFIKSIYWDKKYIVAYKNRIDGTNKYYIIEQLKTDTIIDKVPWTTYNRVPWVTNEYEKYEEFCRQLNELEIDTTEIYHYSWVYILGIY